MDGAAYVMLSGALTFGVPLALAVRELLDLKRRGGGNWDGDGPQPEPTPPPSPRGEKPLPDCLIPKLAPGPVRRVRELEEV